MYVKPCGLHVDTMLRLPDFQAGEGPHGYPYQTTRRDIGLSIAAPNSCIEARRFHVIVNYDNFSIYPDILDEYSAMVRDLADRYYSGATRYSTNGFLRSKLGDALGRRALAPHIYESADEARAHLRELESKVAS